ncbi:MAG: hypothetical protein R3D25_01640 [Geminicoccaceae bacterium]
MVERRQAGRGEDRFERQPGIVEEAEPAGPEVGRGDQERRPPGPTQGIEVDQSLQQVAQRIEVEGVELVGGKQARGGVDDRVRKTGRLQPQGLAPDRAPELGQGGAGPVRPAGDPAGSENHGIDGSGRAAADGAHLQPVDTGQPVEHAPGEGTMRATTLQRQVEAPAPVSRRRPPVPNGRGLRQRVLEAHLAALSPGQPIQFQIESAGS